MKHDEATRAMLEAITAKQRKMELAMLLGANCTSVSRPENVLTVDKLLEIAGSLPHKETWAVSRLFPPNCATLAKTPGENFTLINDGTWRRLEIELRKVQPPPDIKNIFGVDYFSVRPSFLDAGANDDLDVVKARAAELKRILDRIVGVLEAQLELKRVLGEWWRRMEFDPSKL